VNQAQALVRVDNINKSYQTSAGVFFALKNVSFQVRSGEFLAITGKSGAGKTTLINMVTGTDYLTSGDVLVGDLSVHRLSEDQRAKWRGRNVGLVYQSFHLLPNLSLIDNVMLPMDFSGTFQSRKSKERAMELLREVQLEQHARKLPSEISGGQQQRVAIARALVNDPLLIIADEPTGRLDSVTAGVVFDLFNSLVKRGKTILMVTHDETLATQVDRVLFLQDGVLING
jgi:putative ABC transport system ATP-binding protein